MSCPAQQTLVIGLLIGDYSPRTLLRVNIGGKKIRVEAFLFNSCRFELDGPFVGLLNGIDHLV